MMFLTHVLFGILSGYLGSNFLGYGNSLLFVAVVAFASVLPDIDHVSSKLGRRLPPFSVILNLLFSHRGFLHSVFPPLLLYFIVRPLNQAIAAAVLVGYVSHLLLDATTIKGVKLFIPFSRYRVRGFVKTNGFFEKLMLVVFLVLFFLVASSRVLF